MKKNIMNKWVKALRSGKYKQGREKLCAVNGKTGQESYCCLGVLTDLYLKERKRQKKGHNIKFFCSYTKEDMDHDLGFSKWVIDGEDGCLPPEIAEWAGFDTSTDDYKTGCFVKPNNQEIDLAQLNDGFYDYATGKTNRKQSFNKIADVIEANYESI